MAGDTLPQTTLRAPLNPATRLARGIAGVGMALAILGGCGGGGTTTTPQPKTAATPVVSPTAGTYTSSQSVTITDSTSGATIYYTTNGTAPSTASTKYSSAFMVSATETVEAIATASGYTTSAVASATFTISQQQQTVATPAITTTPAQNGAVIVTLADTTAGSGIFYTIDGTTPTTSSILYSAPFLVASNITVNAIGAASGETSSAVATQAFSASIPSGTLVWSDEFGNTTASNTLPSATTWTYDTGYQCCGNAEQETYCAAGSSTSPCDTSNPNAYVAATTGGLNIVARNPSGTTYTSARLKSEGLFSFEYGRIEAMIKFPEEQAMWPAFWLLGNNIASINWPACGEADIMEHIDGANTPFGGPGNGSLPGYDWYQASVHGTGLNGGTPWPASSATPYSGTAWHTYGMIWTKGKIQYYIDSPSNIYETFDTSLAGTWPFDQGPQFIILNLAVGGSWPGNVDSTTTFPQTMQVQYVRIYTN
jgi:beta-glucanase (GH16 family)